VNLLAIDTSSLACSVALRVGDVVIERHEEQAREHTRLLTPMIREVLTESGMPVLGRSSGCASLRPSRRDWRMVPAFR
jgi:tRNA A37 threonylcarbamoyladenosine modification protein TsaB